MITVPSNLFNYEHHSNNIIGLILTNAVKNIGDNAFYKCNTISNVLFLPNTLETVGN